MKIKYLLLFFLLSCLSCKNKNDGNPGEIKFDKNKWGTQFDQNNPYRDKMLKDLMSNHYLRELKQAEVLNLLGEPTRSDTGYLFYRVNESKMGLITLHAKTLVIKFGADSTVEWVKIHE